MSSSSVLVSSRAFAGAYLFGKSRGQRDALSTGRDPELLALMARIEQIVESTSIEIEPFTEGQRFTTMLLAEGKTIQEQR